MSVRLLTENFKSNNLFLWRQLAASGPSPNTFFLSPRCPPAQLGRPAHTRDRLWFNGTVLFVSETGGSRWWHLMEGRFAEKIIGVPQSEKYLQTELNLPRCGCRCGD